MANFLQNYLKKEKCSHANKQPLCELILHLTLIYWIEINCSELYRKTIATLVKIIGQYYSTRSISR